MGRHQPLILAALAAVLLLILPLAADMFWLSLLVHILVFGLLALSVDLLIGHVGLFPMGHAAFFAVAAYTAAICEARHGLPTIIAAPAGLLAAMALAALFGIAVRTKGVYFILVTLAMGFIISGMSVSMTNLTGGDNGITDVPFPALGSWAVQTLHQFYYLALALVALCVWAYKVFISSPHGLTLHGIRESGVRMDSLGYNVLAHKYLAFILSGSLAGMAGLLYIYSNRFVSPETAAFHVSAEVALMAIIGGSGTILGPFVGAALVTVLKNVVGAYLHYWALIMGLVFIATVLWAPYGIMGLIKRARGKDAAGDSMTCQSPVQGE
jgi:branched-chain amino acid transport system permease protein